jgi:hypothetical protein
MTGRPKFVTPRITQHNPENANMHLPTHNIIPNNPKGYGEGEDPRKYDRRLHGPVDPRELEIDPRTGMKNYIANGASIPLCSSFVHSSFLLSGALYLSAFTGN